MPPLWIGRPIGARRGRPLAPDWLARQLSLVGATGSPGVGVCVSISKIKFLFKTTILALGERAPESRFDLRLRFARSFSDCANEVKLIWMIVPNLYVE